MARALLATQRHFGTRSDAHVWCDTLLHFPLDFCVSHAHTPTESPLRRAVSSRSEAQHPQRRTVSPRYPNPKALNTT